ncbi:hypothetical protein Dimus_016929 [Dionaea muscipula]
MSKPRIAPKQCLSRLLQFTENAKPRNPTFHHAPITISTNTPLPNPSFFRFPFTQSRLFSSASFRFDDDDGEIDDGQAHRIIDDLLAEVEREKYHEREARKRAGENVDEEEEEEEDYMGVGPLIEKLEKEELKDDGKDRFVFEEPTDSETEDDDDGDDRFDEDGGDDTKKKKKKEMEKQRELLIKKFKKHEELFSNFIAADTHEESFKWMNEIDKFEQKHLSVRLEYRVIGDMMNRLKQATGKEKFLLVMKLNRAIRMVQLREAYDANNPANYGVIQQELVAPAEEGEDQADSGKEPLVIPDRVDEDEEDEFDDIKEKDDILFEKISAIDAKLEEKLAQLDHTFGKKGRLLEEEIRQLADERNSLTENKRIPLYRKGFDVRLIDVNRTCKVTKGGQMIKYTAILACGNYNGVIGFAKAKGPAVPIALQKAYEKCFQNLHHVDLYEEHTIAHAVQTTYKKTKVYLWPAPTRTGMKAGRTVQTVLNLAGYKNIKSKVIGSRNPHNTVKAVFKALNAIETPKDVQQKFGRTVVESYLL